MSELSQLKDAQYHLSKLEGLIKNNKWYSFVFTPCSVEGELQRQVALLEKDKSEDIPDTEKLYDVLEVSTNGMNPPDASYTSLSRVVAAKNMSLYYLKE